jgi:hypothetical protein
MPDLTPRVHRSKGNAIIILMGTFGGAFALLMVKLFVKTGEIVGADGKAEIVPAGKGDGNIPAIVARIAAKEAVLEQDVVLTLEPHLALFDGYAQIDNTELKHEYRFDSATEAFSAAANALKGILTANGYQEIAGGIWKHASRT